MEEKDTSHGGQLPQGPMHVLVDGHLGITLQLSIPHPYFLTSWCSLGFPRPPGWPTIGLHSAGLQAQL